MAAINCHFCRCVHVRARTHTLAGVSRPISLDRSGHRSGCSGPVSPSICPQVLYQPRHTPKSRILVFLRRCRCHVHTPFLLLPQTDTQTDRRNDTWTDPSPQRATAVCLIRHTDSPMQLPTHIHTHTFTPACTHTLDNSGLLIDVMDIIILS